MKKLHLFMCLDHFWQNQLVWIRFHLVFGKPNPSKAN